MTVKKRTIWFRSALSATYEVGFISIPIIVWVGAILSASPTTSISQLTAWPFLALSLWGNALRDSVRAYSSNLDPNRDVQVREKYQREAVVVLSVIGIVGTSVLLTCTVLYSLKSISTLWPAHWPLIWVSLVFAAATFWTAKAILIQRSDYGHYV